MEAELLDIMDAGSPGKISSRPQGPPEGRPFASDEAAGGGDAPPTPAPAPAPAPTARRATAPATPLPRRPEFAIGVVTDVERVPKQLVHLCVFMDEVKKVPVPGSAHLPRYSRDAGEVQSR